MPRKSRDSKVPDQELLKPFDVMKFGSDDDPCFGKLYDLNEDECLICGDCELCSIVFANKANKKRLEWEQENPTLDMKINASELQKDIKDWISTAKQQGIKGLKLKVKLKSRFSLTEEGVAKYL